MGPLKTPSVGECIGFMCMFVAVVAVIVALTYVAGTLEETYQPYFDEGYLAGTVGIPATACPYDKGPIRMHWMEGWQEGFILWRDGEHEKARGTDYN